jgi:hypothetical protein
MALLAIETAIQNINFQIHFGAPYQNELKAFILPIFTQLLSDCPDDLRPVWRPIDGKYVFKNGSYIKLCGCNNGQYENLRGNKSDLFIIDEAAQVDKLDEVIRSVALPQLLSSKNPNKRIILPSTPPTTPDHPFKKHVEQAKAKGAYSCYTIDDGWYSKDEIDKMAQDCGGRTSTVFRREFLAEFVVESSLQILPEWDKKYIQEIQKDDYFQFYQIVEGLDIGYRDFTAWIMGYWDFQNARLVIENEIALRENDFTTKKLADAIKEYEIEYQKVNKTRIRRVSDNNNLNMLADLSREFGLAFAPVIKKHGANHESSKEWMVSQTRKFIKDGKLAIHPRCKKLIASLEFGIWKDGCSEFATSEELGHYDFIDALIYLVSGLIPAVRGVNPIPPLYKINVAQTMFPNGLPKNDVDNPQNEVIKSLFKFKI